MSNLNKINTFALIMLITGAIDSIRNLPATALFGSALIFFFIISALVFLIPVALVSAELSSQYTKKNGIFHWAYLAFGEKMAFFAVWLQWINTMVWFPTILSFIAGIASYLINPDLAQNKSFLIVIILATYWGMTWVNLRGVHFSAQVASVCTVLGLIIPMLLIIGLALIWVITNHPLQIHFTVNDMIPSLHHYDNWVSLTAIMAAFLGMELATVHVRDVHQPQITFPRALFFSVIIILATMILGSLAIAIILPKEQLNLVNGVMQAFTEFFNVYHLSWMIPIIALMLLIGSVGNLMSWMISPAKGLLHAAQLGYLPPMFVKENKNGVAANLLILQAIVVSIVAMVFILVPSINVSYWLLTDLSTEAYILMYMIMFISAILIKKNNREDQGAFHIPGGRAGMYGICIIGLFGCMATFAVGFIPPAGLNIGSTISYEIMFVAGLVGMISPAWLFYLYQKKHKACLN